MLSGKVPFQVLGPDRATKIMDRIKGGQFSMQSKEWSVVSESAKLLIRGTRPLLSSCRLQMI